MALRLPWALLFNPVGVFAFVRLPLFRGAFLIHAVLIGGDRLNGIVAGPHFSIGCLGGARGRCVMPCDWIVGNAREDGPTGEENCKVFCAPRLRFSEPGKGRRSAMP